MEIVKRTGDMGQGTKLCLLKDNEGDIHVSVIPKGKRMSLTPIEFCNSGTKSRTVVRALHELFNAMKEDALNCPDGNPTECIN